MDKSSLRRLLERTDADLRVVTAEAARALQLATDWSGHLRSGFGAGAHGGDVSDPTGNAATAPTQDYRRALTQDLEAMYRATARAANTVADIVGAGDRAAHEAAEEELRRLAAEKEAPAGRGDCLACETPCSGAEGDRLRGGLCNACRMAFDRQEPAKRALGIPHFKELIVQAIVAGHAKRPLSPFDPVRLTERTTDGRVA